MFITSLFVTVTSDKTSTMEMFFVMFLVLFISTIWYTFVAIVFKKNYFRTLYINNKKIIEYISGIIFILFGIKSVFTI
jgi:threonine/homoserine/homoserine lactone efflux protein